MFIRPKSRYYKERNVQSKKRQAIRRWFVSIRHGRHVLSQCPKQRHFSPVLRTFFNISGGWMPLFRALAKNMAPMTNADESAESPDAFSYLPVSLYSIYSLIRRHFCILYFTLKISAELEQSLQRYLFSKMEISTFRGLNLKFSTSIIRQLRIHIYSIFKYIQSPVYDCPKLSSCERIIN